MFILLDKCNDLISMLCNSINNNDRLYILDRISYLKNEDYLYFSTWTKKPTDVNKFDIVLK